MPVADNGPYETERQARAAAHAGVAPGTGQVILDRGGNIRLLFLALEDTGVVTGSHENKIAAWLANYEDSTMAVVAGWIRRAFEAGRAVGPDGAVTEWAIAYTHRPSLGLSPRRVVQRYPDEATAREAVADIRRMEPGDEPAVMSRQVGPWTPADETVARNESEEGNG